MTPTNGSLVDLRRPVSFAGAFCGFPRQKTPGPKFYPVACMPQAWAAAAPLYLLQYCASLAFDTAAQRVTFHETAPSPLPGGGRSTSAADGGGGADVALRRSNRHLIVDVLDRQGSVGVVTIN